MAAGKNDYINDIVLSNQCIGNKLSFGAGSTKIGSLGVVTVNFPRLAMQSETKEEFLEKVSEMYEVTAKINNAKRSIIKKRISLGAAPLYSLGYMSLTKQYSTFGVTGLNEAVELLGMDILEEEGQDFVTEVLKLINEKINEANKKYKSPHNVEQVKKYSTCYNKIKIFFLNF